MNKNISLVISSLSAGGAERVLVNLANYWADKGWSVAVITIENTDSDFYQLHPSITRVALNLAKPSITLSDALFNNWRRIRALRSILENLKTDIAVAFMTGTNILLALSSIRAPWSAVGSEHVYPPQLQARRIWMILRRLTYFMLDKVCVLTEDMDTWVRKNTAIRRTSIIHNPVWPIEEQEPVVEPDEILSSEVPVLLGVGRLTEQKGFDLLLKAFANVAPKQSQWHLIILGEGAKRAALESQVRSLGLEGRVSLPGVVGNMSDWYQRADLYVMSSRWEGFGNTLAEALASGLPAISFDCDTGPRDIIRHEVDGLLIPSGDVVGLATALKRLMGDDRERLAFSKRAVEARDRFSTEKIADEWRRVFEEVSE